MIKKLFSFVCCLAPMGAIAAEPVYLTPTDSTGIYTTEDGLTVTAADDARVVGNRGDKATTDLIIKGSGGLNVVGLSVGDTESFGTGFLYVPNNTASSTSTGFEISTVGPVSITSLLRVLDGQKLTIAGFNGSRVNMTIGDGAGVGVQNAGNLSLAYVADFVSNSAISNTGNLTIYASTVTVKGQALENKGTATILSAGAMDMQTGTITNITGATSANIMASSLSSGAIQNNSGTMNINVAGGDLKVVDSTDSEGNTVSGVIENKNGTSMSIDADNITVAGAMTNEGNNSSMRIVTTGDLVINGKNTAKNTNGTSMYNDASFVNGGNLYVDVAGKTQLANGFDVSTMATNNTFELATGTLDFGADPTNWLRLFSNKLNKFVVNIREGDIDASTAIINGAGGNTNANMTLTAQNINVGSVNNSGNKLYIALVDKDGENNDVVKPIVGNISIDNGITANSGDTRIWAAGTLQNKNGEIMAADGASMHLSGEKGVTLTSVSNSGDLRIQSSNATDGSIVINGTVTNEGNGELNIESRDITIAGTLTANGGETTIKGSDTNGDSLAMGQVDVKAGVLNIDALKGGITMSGPLTVRGQGAGGAMNIGASTTRLDVTGAVLVSGDVTLSPTPVSTGNSINIGGQGVQNFVMTSTGTMTFGGIDATQSDANRTAQFIAKNVLTDDGVTQVANTISVGDDGIAAKGQGALVFGNAENRSNVTTTGAVIANKDGADNAGSIEFWGDQVTVGSLGGAGKFTTHGTVISATKGNIDIADSVWFDGSNPTSGLIISDTNEFTLTTAAEGAQGGSVSVGGVSVASGNKLNINSAKDVALNGVVTDNGTIDINATAGDVTVANDLTVATTSEFAADAVNIHMAGLVNNNKATLTAAEAVTTREIQANAGDLTINSESLSATSLNVASGAQATIGASDITVSGTTTVAGNLVQGNANGALNLTNSFIEYSGQALDVRGAFNVDAGLADYNMSGAVDVAGDITVADGAGAFVDAQSITAKNVTNRGKLALQGRGGIVLDGGNGIIENFGDLTLDSGTRVTNVANFISTGTATLAGAGLKTAGAFEQATLYQGAPMWQQEAGDVNITSSDYAITASNVTVDAIKQHSGKMVLNTSDLTVAGGIDATGLRVVATPATNWLNVGVLGGDVSGNAQFIGLEHMQIAGNYTFNNNSAVSAVILPYATGASSNSTSYNYWADVSLDNNSTFGQITNRGGESAEPLISVGGTFITDLNVDMHDSALAAGKPAATDQFSIKIFDMIDQGTAIWLLHADNGIKELATKIRNLNVQFCNADGSKCFDYYGSAEQYNQTGEDLPAYLSVRDTDGDGQADSVYVVFDPSFGGPLALFKIQPIVERVPDHSKAEYVSAGALDDLIEGQLIKSQFTNRTPIDAIPVAFAGTNMEQLANELYKRMEYYDISRDGTGLARFSRLTQAREAEQLAGSVALNEHTTFRDFEDRMLDEFIWHRNRNLRKAWGEFDFGLFNQKGENGKDIDGNRFSFNGGYDWQESQTLILGLAGHISHTSGDNSDDMNLGYKPGEFIAGHMKTDVSDTNVGIGGYLMKTLGTKMRLYGNAFLDMHWLDVSRDQTYVDKISGDGTAFSLISEWGLMHDWLNQYIVGNLYVRGGYNTGFSVTEKVHGRDYMKLESDGYFILTPGYSLIAQKRIYPTSWFQIRPYVSVGAEYDVFGAPDEVKYKFAPASHYTKYDVDIDPLWANIGGGMEFVSSMGLQIGLDYRYQYNADIQMHKIKVSGSYRF